MTSPQAALIALGLFYSATELFCEAGDLKNRMRFRLLALNCLR
jgi:hypothetical protein